MLGGSGGMAEAAPLLCWRSRAEQVGGGAGQVRGGRRSRGDLPRR